MTISKRLILLASIAILAMLSIAGMGLTQMQRVYDQTNISNENIIPGMKLLAQARFQFMVMRIRVNRHIMGTDPQIMADIDATIVAAHDNVSKALADYEQLIAEDEDRRFLENEKKQFATYHQAVEGLLELSRQNRKEEAHKKIEGMTKLAQDLQNTFGEHIKFNGDRGMKAAHDAAAIIKSAWWLLAGVSVIAILIAGGLVLQIRASLLARLAEANHLAAAIASGDLSSRNTPVKISEDEIGKLIVAMESMRQGLATTVSAIAANSDQLASSAAQLSTTALQVSTASQNQSGSTAASAAAVEQLTVSIDHVGTSSEEASDQAQQAGILAIDSVRNVEAAAQQINQVADSVGETAQQIETLSEHIKQVGNITTVIRDVADQTNLLALNAAIEAARAGEQGRGFAVVADEVRKLAERTTLSVQEISTVISTIQNSVGQAVGSMQKNFTQVSDVVHVANSASASMDGIRSATEMVRDAITGISEAMREQRSASTELSRNVEAIAQMSEENSAAVASVADTAHSLVSVSDNLKTAVSRFRLQ